MANLSLEKTVDVRTDYLSHGSIPEIMDKFKISRDKVTKILASEDETSKRLAEANIQVIMSKQTEKMMTVTDEVLSFINEAVAAARNSDQPHLFIDKVASAWEKMDRVARLNMNRATTISETRSTHVRLDVAEVMKGLDTPDKRKDFLRDQLTFKKDDRDSKNIGNNTATVVKQTS